MHPHGEALGIFSIICALILIALLIYTQIINRRHHHHHEIEAETAHTQEFKVSGMSCPHCKANVERAISALEGVESVEVDLKGGTASVTGDIDPDKVIETVRMAGYDCAR